MFWSIAGTDFDKNAIAKWKVTYIHKIRPFSRWGLNFISPHATFIQRS